MSRTTVCSKKSPCRQIQMWTWPFVQQPRQEEQVGMLPFPTTCRAFSLPVKLDKLDKPGELLDKCLPVFLLQV